MVSHCESEENTPDRSLTAVEKAALLAQLHYDRADIARVCKPAAAAMDIVIAMLTAAFRQGAEGPP